MPVFEIESNGLIENTVIYYNGKQIAGIKEVFLNLDEEGTFDSIIKYTGTDGALYTKNIFTDYLTNLKTTEPTLTDEDAEGLRPLTIDSSGDIETTIVAIDDFEQDGIVSLLVHIVAPQTQEKKGFSLFGKKTEKEVDMPPTFIADITFRNEDDSQETERIF